MLLEFRVRTDDGVELNELFFNFLPQDVLCVRHRFVDISDYGAASHRLLL